MRISVDASGGCVIKIGAEKKKTTQYFLYLVLCQQLKKMVSKISVSMQTELNKYSLWLEITYIPDRMK